MYVYTFVVDIFLCKCLLCLSAIFIITYKQKMFQPKFCNYLIYVRKKLEQYHSHGL